jgi:hypothetical protein
VIDKFAHFLHFADFMGRITLVARELGFGGRLSIFILAH